MRWQTKERAIEIIVSSVGLISVLVLLLIGFFLFKEAFYIFYKVSVLKIIFGTDWCPTYEPPSFGMFPLLIGTFAGTTLTAIMAISLGLGTAVYIAEVANHRVKEILKPLIEMLASFPSVVLGFLGMVAGGAAVVPHWIFNAARPMPAAIAARWAKPLMEACIITRFSEYVRSYSSSLLY